MRSPGPPWACLFTSRFGSPGDSRSSAPCWLWAEWQAEVVQPMGKMSWTGSHPPSDPDSGEPASGPWPRYANRSGWSSDPAHPKSARLQAIAALEVDCEHLIESASSDVRVVRQRVQR